ncbi:MAG: Rrf2 family transcriptional regulator [Candidatus Marinimicrobia bacterium]|nr:Rrf2 family transcriptional regulator [Candidatus Neomarinimicrobiota bacterium]
MLGISKAADYSILVVGFLAAQSSECVHTKETLANELNLPSEFLSKVLQKLVKAEIVESVKGLHGGYRLLKIPAEITLREVIEVMEGPPHMVNCLKDDFIDCGRQQICHPIIEKMQAVENQVTAILEKINFTELIPYIPTKDSKGNK